MPGTTTACEVCGHTGDVVLNKHNVLCCSDDMACWERFCHLDRGTKKVLRKRARGAQAVRASGS